MEGSTNARNLTRLCSIFKNIEKVGSVVEKNSKQKERRMKSHQEFSWQLWMLIIFYKAIGLATFTPCNADQKRKDLQTSYAFKYSKIGIAYNLVLISLIIIRNFLSIPYNIRTNYPNKTNMTVGIEIFQTLLGGTAVTSILLIYCFQQKNLLRIGNRLTDVEHTLDRLYRLHPSLRRKRIFRVLTVVCICNSIMAMFLVIDEYVVFLPTSIFWFSEILSTCHLGWFMIQYFLLVTIIQAAFADLNCAIRCLAGITTPYLQSQSATCQTRRVNIGNSTLHQLLELRDVHAELCDISQDVSDFYSMSMLFAISYMFFSLVYNGYYLILPLLLSNAILEYKVLTNTVLWLIFLLYPVHLLTNGITKLLNEMARTSNTINNLMNCMIDKEIKSELQQILLQLLSRKVYFTANGYFTLDNTLFHSILSAMTTYLVILTQFQLGNSSKSHCNCTQQGSLHMKE